LNGISAKLALVSCAVGVLTLQRLGGAAMLLLCAVLLLVAVVVSRERLLALLRRSRFLFLAMLLLYSFGTPGTRLLLSDYLPVPTVEGLSLAALHCSRLAGLIAAVALLVTTYARSSLLGAFYSCALPFLYLGAKSDRLVVRASLALDLVSQAAAGQGFRSWLIDSRSDLEGPREAVILEVTPWSRLDVVCVLFLMLLSEAVVRWCQ
jgi:hypothetical protein